MNRENIYFSHDANAMSDPKCMLLIDQLGMEGYGMFWGLVELLRQQPEYKLSLLLIPAIANRFKVSESKLKTVISGYGLFLTEGDDFFFSKSLRDRMELMDEKKNRYALAGRKSGEVRRQKALCGNEQRSNNVQTTFEHRLNKEKKELSTTNVVSSSSSYNNKDSYSDKGSKEIERGESSETSVSSRSKAKAFSPPSIDEVKRYCEERGNGINAQQFVDFYQSKGWLIGKNKMKDWKCAVRTWEIRDKESYANKKEQQNERYCQL